MRTIIIGIDLMMALLRYPEYFIGKVTELAVGGEATSFSAPACVRGKDTAEHPGLFQAPPKTV